MSKRTLPAIRALCRPDGEAVPSETAVKRWQPGLEVKAAEGSGQNVIQILESIGEDIFGLGVTARRIGFQLRELKGQDVFVHINSPGGDVFEGMAIYNLLREHDGAVTVKVLGLAASAASIVAMAGDTIQCARAGFFMVHNAWGAVVGNRHDMREAAKLFEEVDAAMAEVYVARTGLEAREVDRMMDAETMLSGSTAVEKGFADSLLPSDEISEKKSPAATALYGARLADAILARAGLPRGDRAELIRGLREAAPAGGGLRDAADQGASLGEVLSALQSIKL